MMVDHFSSALPNYRSLLFLFLSLSYASIMEVDLIAKHPNLAPELLRVLSDSLTASQEKVKVLEEKVKEQEAAAAAAHYYQQDLATLGVELTAMGEENQRLALAAEVKTELVDSESNNRLCQEKLVQLDSKICRREATDALQGLSQAALQGTFDAERLACSSHCAVYLARHKSLLEVAVAQFQSKSHNTRRSFAELQTVHDDVVQKLEQGKRAHEELQASYDAAMQDKVYSSILMRATQNIREDRAILQLKEHDAAIQALSEKLRKVKDDGAQGELEREHLHSELHRSTLALEEKDQELLWQRQCTANWEDKWLLMQKEAAEFQEEKLALKTGLCYKDDECLRLVQDVNDLKAELVNLQKEYDEAKNAINTVGWDSALKYQTFREEYIDMAQKYNIVMKEQEERDSESKAIPQKAIENALNLSKENKVTKEKLARTEAQCLAYAQKLKEYNDYIRALDKSRSLSQLQPPNKPEKQLISQERTLYYTCMNALPHPSTSSRPHFSNLIGIHRVENIQDYFQPNFPTKRFVIFSSVWWFETGALPSARRSAHFPQRQIWTSPECVHALVFAPTREYRSAVNTGPPCVASLSDEMFDLFVTGTGRIYVVRKMRDVHRQGSVCPSDVPPEAIQRAIAESGKKIVGPIPNANLKTECFGLQCLGFDSDL
ncbi:hypothetical protein B0H19DRAFT_1252446 [Mycena capillaripes]|nr:hypothetical protein B0H19DRAFT_1252446 [Mycena capillaripes]